MKIHFIALETRDPWGGSEELWSKAALFLAGQGHHVSVSAKFWPEKVRHKRFDELAKAGTDVRYWRKTRPSKETLRGVLVWLSRGMSGPRPPVEPAWKIPVGVDLVVINSASNKFSDGLVKECKARSLPYVLICQLVSETNWMLDSYLETARRIFKEAAAVCFVSKANMESMACQLAWKGANFRVVSNPYTVDRGRPFSLPNIVDEGNFQMAFVGRMDPSHKGLDLLLRALARSQWKDRNFRLNLYGKGQCAEQLREMADFLGIADKLVFHGHASSVDAIWDANQILLMPSRHEGLPLAVIEAMMRGRPCLVTDVSGNPEHVRDGINGFLAAGPTVNAIDQALENAWARRASWGTMGEAAYADIRAAIPEVPEEAFSKLLVELVQSVV